MGGLFLEHMEGQVGGRIIDARKRESLTYQKQHLIEVNKCILSCYYYCEAQVISLAPRILVGSNNASVSLFEDTPK
jgi:hypothetical protein